MTTEILSIADMKKWVPPRFQRPLKANEKVFTLAEDLRSDPCITGVITLGKLPGDPTLYLVDGQHRRRAAEIASAYENGPTEFIADVRVMKFVSLSDMAEEAVRLQGQLVKTSPDDILKGLEESNELLRKIRESCSFIGYSYIRANADRAPILGMSAALRSWYGSSFDVPSVYGAAIDITRNLTPDDADNMIEFLLNAYDAWGRDFEYHKLWTGNNLCLCMWLWRVLVMDHERRSKRYVALNPELFKLCLMSISADHNYCSWLVGRTNKRDRAPCYARIKKIFIKRLTEEGEKNIKMPQPTWATNS
jgi:hypothetical protein